MSKTKICVTCKKEKILDQFYNSSRYEDGKNRKCIACCKETYEKGKKTRKDRRIPEEKFCSWCKEEHPSSEFNKDSRYKDGLASRCKKGQVEYSRENRKGKNYQRITEGTKKCLTCNKEKPVADMVADKNSKDGLAVICYECDRKRGKKNRERIKHPPQIYILKTCTGCGIEKQGKEFPLDPSHSDGLKSKCYECDNERRRRQKQETGGYKLQWEKIKKDPIKRTEHALRGSLTKALKSKGVKKKCSAIRNLGCSKRDFMKRVESKFYQDPESLEIMTWENYGDLWHIDHIIPISWFDLSDEREQIIAVNYRNLQPLWAKDNYDKRDKFPDEVPQDLLDFIKETYPDLIRRFPS